MSGNEHIRENINYMERFNSIKNQIPERQGTYIGGEGKNFYIARSEDEIYELSPLAYYVWLLCDGKHTVDELAHRMSNDLKMSLDEIIEPLVMALNGLCSVNLVIMKEG